ncbi:MAG: TrkH family potassium uptake protein [bacterium]
MNQRAVCRVLGFLYVVTGVCLLLPAGVALLYGESDWPAFLVAAALGGVIGGLAMRVGRGAPDLGIREGFAVVTFGWLSIGLLGAVPFLLSGQIPGIADAVFESISGFTTTGASILTDIEGRSHATLFWRSLSQWLGGMGIVVLALAILPLLGVGGMQLYRAEAPGPTPDRLTPRIRETAKRLWGVYVLLTGAETILLMLAGLGFFDAICHSLATMATGGFSTRNASVGAYGSAGVEWVIILFMFLAGTNFTLHYLALLGKPKSYLRDEEFRWYVLILAGAGSIILTPLLLGHYYPLLGDAVRHTVFQVISICSTTGFGTADYLLWPPVAGMLLVLLMAMGGCAGSTGGGIKVLRAMLLAKSARLELKKLVHPRGVYTMWFNNKSLPPTLATNVLGFFLLFMMVYLFGVLVLTFGGRDMVTAIGATSATLGNIGPGLGLVGPTSNYAFLADWEKWLLMVFMLIGRLEIYTVLVLFLPEAWRKS